MKEFETEYRKWMEKHINQRKGERLRRLKEQHGFGEKLLVEQVWWPVVGNFDFLHPEYEVVDEDGNYYYLDFAYVRNPKPAALESDGFNPHAREADRNSFKKSRRRQNAIVLGGWNILRFSTDDLKEDPDHCRRTLRRMFERWYGEDPMDGSGLSVYQKEILRFAVQSVNPFTPKGAEAATGLSGKYVRKLLHDMVKMGLLEPASGDRRWTSYKLKNSGTVFRYLDRVR